MPFEAASAAAFTIFTESITGPSRPATVEADFPDTLLYLRNYDKPGFIGDLGSLCGRHGINIATFHLGRKEEGGEAIALVEIDQQIGPDVMAELRGLQQVVRADLLHFA